jgi:hypothetical protein
MRSGRTTGRAAALPGGRALRVAAAALLAALPGQAAQAQDATCTWFRVSPEAFEEGPCEVEWTGEGARVTMGVRDWTIRDRNRQGQWARVSLNGLEAMRYQIDRTRYAYATPDLNEFLDVQQ